MTLSIETVSYTHLDVYKRQAAGRKVGAREELQVVELKKQRPPDLEAIKLWHSLNRPAAGGAAVPLYVVDDVGPGHGGGD